MTIIPAAQLQQILFDAGITSLDTWIADSVYTPLSAAWIETTLRAGWCDTCAALGITKPEPEDGDCDDYALGLMWYARTLHRRTKDRPRGMQLAIGELWYTMDSTHAKDDICPVVILETGRLALRFIRPQPQQFGFVEMNPDELESIYYLRI